MAKNKIVRIVHFRVRECRIPDTNRASVESMNELLRSVDEQLFRVKLSYPNFFFITNVSIANQNTVWYLKAFCTECRLVVRGTTSYWFYVSLYPSDYSQSLELRAQIMKNEKAPEFRQQRRFEPLPTDDGVVTTLRLVILVLLNPYFLTIENIYLYNVLIFNAFLLIRTNTVFSFCCVVLCL